MSTRSALCAPCPDLAHAITETRARQRSLSFLFWQPHALPACTVESCKEIAMNQRPLRLFVSYAGNEILNEPLFQRLIEDLRAQYVEMILDDGHSHSETEMLGEL